MYYLRPLKNQLPFISKRVKLASMSSISIKNNGVPEGYTQICEGSAAILSENGNKVFYNEVQVKNRDLSVLVLNAYAEQLELEAKCQVNRRKRNVSWRKVPPTVQTWGKSYLEEEETVWKEKEIAKPEADIPDEKIETEGMFILEALGASGLRSIRYANEITKGVGLDKILCNDLEPHAVENMKKNIEHNINSYCAKSEYKVNALKTKLETNVGDATSVMMNHRLSANVAVQHTKVKKYLEHLEKKDEHNSTYVKDFKTSAFDVIDIDPYGSCAPFVDSAIQAVRDGGLLCVTSTDLATLCGKDLEVCFAKYGVMSLKAKYCHEFAIRTILACLERHANKYGRYIVPLFSIQTDFYLRCFIRVYCNKAEIKKSALKQGLIFQSSSCASFYMQPLAQEAKGVHKPPPFSVPSVCPETGSALKIAGPIWTAPIHNKDFLKQLLKMYKVQPKKNDNPYLKHWDKNDFRKEGKAGFDPNLLESGSTLYGIISVALDELSEPESVLFYNLHAMCKTIKISCPPVVKVQSAIINAGYKVSQVHCSPLGLKTTAPAHFIWDILRVWMQQTAAPKLAKLLASDEANLNETEKLQKKILQKEVKAEIDFTMNSEVMRLKNKRKGMFTQKDGKKSYTKKVARFKPNPKPNWGPKARAKGSSNLQTHKRGHKK